MMNAMRKKSVVDRYTDLLTVHTEEEIHNSLKEDKLDLTDEEIVECMETLFANLKPKSAATPDNRAGVLRPYTKCKVKPEYEKVTLRNGRKEDILKGLKKVEQLGITVIEARHAEILNQQVMNSMIYFFPEGKDFVEAADIP